MFFMKKRLINENIVSNVMSLKQGILTMSSSPPDSVTRLAGHAHRVVTLLMWGWPTWMIGYSYWVVEHRLPDLQDKCSPGVLPVLSWVGKSFVGVGMLLTALALFYSLGQVRVLLAEYRAGRVFEARAARQLTWIGKLVLLWSIGNPLSEVLLHLMLWAIGELPIDDLSTEPDFIFLLFGLLLYVLGRIMGEAVHVAEDQRLTI